MSLMELFKKKSSSPVPEDKPMVYVGAKEKKEVVKEIKKITKGKKRK